ncbi:MLO-like protein 8 [Orobanche hederae]
MTTNQSRLRLAHETLFVRAHMSCWTRFPILFYIARSLSLMT